MQTVQIQIRLGAVWSGPILFVIPQSILWNKEKKQKQQQQKNNYILDRSISNRRDFCLVFIITIYFIKIPVFNANSVDPD